MGGELHINDIVDIHAYPLASTDAKARRMLVDPFKAQLDQKQYCAVPGFVRPKALSLMTAEAMAVRPFAFDNNSRRNVYLQRQPDPALPEDHPRNVFATTSTRMIAYDQIPKRSPLKTFYHSAEVRNFIADIVGIQALYDNEDPYQPANYICYNKGDRSSWHFDADNSFTVTLMVQKAEQGGEFEMSPNCRADDDQQYDRVGQFLRGELDNSIASVSREPGALCIFRGCNSLHRVSPVLGSAMRIMGVFVYEREPGIIGDQEVNETIYGERVSR